MNKEEEGRVIDLMDYWRVVVRRKNFIFAFAGIIILLVGIYSFAVAPKYMPAATILIGQETSKLLNLQDEFGSSGYRGTVQDLVYINTQLSLLKSIALAKRVAEKMELLSHPRYQEASRPHKGLIGKFKYLATLRWAKLGKKTSDEQQNLEDPYIEIAQNIQENLKAVLIRETDIVKLSFVSSDPVLATEIVNTYADEFINYSIDVKYKTTEQAKDFLSEQITLLRNELSSKERELQRYSQEKDLLFLNDRESLAINEYSELHRAFAAAQVQRINAQATYRELRSMDIESPPQILENRVIQDLSAEYTRLRTQYEELSKQYGPNHPEMIRRKATLESMKQNLQAEVQMAVLTAETNYRAALRKENDLKAALKGQEVEVSKMNSNKILYNSLRIEVENIQGSLKSIEEMRKETEVSTRLAGIKAINISIIDYALVPEHPASPKKKLNLILALLVGLSGGIALCFIFEYLDNTLKGSEDLERISGLPSLGMIPYILHNEKKKRSSTQKFESSYSLEQDSPGRTAGIVENSCIELINHRYPNLAISEDYRTVRTSILLSQNSGSTKIFAFSSTMPQEGKTVTVANTAVSFAQLGKKVVVIDADLRRPRLHRLFETRNTKGLSGFLANNNSLEDILQKTKVDNIWLIPSGPIPPNPAELLESNRMKLLLEGIKNEIDFVLIDTPPVLAVVDTVVIGSLVRNMVLIAQPEKTNRRAFLNSIERLTQSNAKIIGVIFNKTDPQRKKYSDKYYYYQEYYSSQNQS